MVHRGHAVFDTCNVVAGKAYGLLFVVCCVCRVLFVSYLLCRVLFGVLFVLIVCFCVCVLFVASFVVGCILFSKGLDFHLDRLLRSMDLAKSTTYYIHMHTFLFSMFSLCFLFYNTLTHDRVIFHGGHTNNIIP